MPLVFLCHLRMMVVEVPRLGAGKVPLMSTTHQPDLAQRYQLTMTACEVESNPHMADTMPAGSTHWEVTLERVDDPARYMTFVYSMGPACATPPAPYDVLTCLRSDASLWESGDLESFGDWCGSWGGNPDSISDRDRFWALRAGVEDQTADVRFVLQDDYAAFLADDDLS